jgi:Domain of unknown function (DUF4304)
MICCASPAENFASLVKAVFEHAPEHGYKKSGQRIKKIAYGNASIVEFQKSRDNTTDCIKFTLNLAIVCGEMLKVDGLKYPFGTTLQNAKAVDGHLDLRIGHIINNKDTWWEITKYTDMVNLKSEICHLIYQIGIPYIENYLKSEDLLNLWTSNGFHGLMIGQRDRYIQALADIVQNVKLNRLEC